MPIPEEMKERITSSKVADLLQHDWVRWGGGLYASAFLREFTGGLPWAHLDIAGKEMNLGGPYGHVPSRRHRLRRHHAGRVRPRARRADTALEAARSAFLRAL